MRKPPGFIAHGIPSGYVNEMQTTPRGAACSNRRIEQYDELLIRAGNTCEICATPVLRMTVGRGRGGTNVACVDHCHVTGKVRGILCKQCNAWLGRVGDDPIKALRYLEKG